MRLLNRHIAKMVPCGTLTMQFGTWMATILRLFASPEVAFTARQPTSPPNLAFRVSSAKHSPSMASNDYVNLPLEAHPPGDAKELTISFWSYGGPSLPKNTIDIGIRFRPRQTPQHPSPMERRSHLLGCRRRRDMTASKKMTSSTGASGFTGAFKRIGTADPCIFTKTEKSGCRALPKLVPLAVP